MPLNNEIIQYDDFYIAYFNAQGNMIYPTIGEEAQMIKKILSLPKRNNRVYIEGKNICYKINIKRKVFEGNAIQMIELSNIYEFIDQVSHASVDEITHLNNRKIARNQFMEYIEFAYQTGQEFSVILADIDAFKEVNDTYGHINGDIVLSEVSRILFCSTRQERYREPDIVARLGGDEFVIILKNISEEVSKEKSEKLRKLVEEKRITLFSETEKGPEQCINAGTLSIGLYHVTAEDLADLYSSGYTTDEIRSLIIDRCDTALYKSKNNGKNRVTAFSNEKILKLKKI